MAWQGQTARPEGVPSLAVAGRDGCPWRHRGRRGSKGGQAAGPSRHASVGRGSAPACERPARRRLVPDVLLDASLSGWAWPSGWSQAGGLLDDKAAGLASWVGDLFRHPTDTAPMITDDLPRMERDIVRDHGTQGCFRLSTTTPCGCSPMILVVPGMSAAGFDQNGDIRSLRSTMAGALAASSRTSSAVI